MERVINGGLLPMFDIIRKQDFFCLYISSYLVGYLHDYVPIRCLLHLGLCIIMAGS